MQLDHVETGAVEGYIDDVVNVFIADSEGNIHKGSQAIPLALDVISRPNHSNEPLPREDLLSYDKAEAEAALQQLMQPLWAGDEEPSQAFIDGVTQQIQDILNQPKP